MPRPTPEEIALLLSRFDASSWDELDLKMGDFRLKLSTSNTPIATASAAPASAHAALPAAAPAPVAAVAPAPAPAVALPAGHAIKAPSLGRFWSKPKPSDPPFVTVGAQINAGDVVCLVEVMKLFTQVKSDVTGKVVAIAVTDGAMVEHDDILVVIQPGAS